MGRWMIVPGRAAVNGERVPAFYRFDVSEPVSNPFRVTWSGPFRLSDLPASQTKLKLGIWFFLDASATIPLVGWIDDLDVGAVLVPASIVTVHSFAADAPVKEATIATMYAFGFFAALEVEEALSGPDEADPFAGLALAEHFDAAPVGAINTGMRTPPPVDTAFCFATNLEALNIGPLSGKRGSTR